MSLILASASPRRRQLLAMVRPDYTVQASTVDESAITAATPALLAQALARAKARDVSSRCPGQTVLGCDTVVEFDGRVFGKPHSREQAVEMLHALSGARHLVHTGVCLAQDGREECFVATTVVEFFAIDEAELQAYADTDEPYDKAGGYAIQGRAAVWCAGIEGCYYNIMGLPVSRVKQALEKFAL